MTPERLLIIDNTETAAPLRTRLLRLGYTIVERCTSLDEGAISARGSNPDLALLNVRCADDLQEKSRNDPGNPRLHSPLMYYTVGGKGAESGIEPSRTDRFVTVIPDSDKDLVLAIEHAYRLQQAHAPARTRAQQYESILDLFSDGVVVLRRDCTILSMNAQAYALTGRNADTEYLGKSVFSLLAPEDPKQMVHILNDLSSCSFFTNREYSCRRPDGNTILLDLSCSSVRDERTEGSSIVFVFREAADRTDRNAVFQGSPFLQSAASSIARTLLQAHQVDALFSEMLDEAHRLVPQADRGRIFLHDTSRDRFTLIRMFGFTDIRVASSNIHVRHAYIGEAAHSHIAIVFRDVTARTGKDATRDIPELHEVRSALAIPFTVSEAIVGILCLESPLVGVFSDDDLDRLDAYVEHVSIAVCKELHSTAREPDTIRLASDESRQLGIFSATLDGTLLSCDVAYANLLGYTTPDELISSNRYNFYKEKPEKCLLDGNATHGSLVTHDKVLLHRRDGSERWFVETTLGVWDEDRNAEVIEGTLIDIDECPQGRKFLPGPGDDYLELFDDFPVPIWRSDTGGRMVFFNKAWMRFTGISKDQRDMTFHVDLIHREDLQSYLHTFFEVLERKTSHQIEYRLRHVSGEYKRVVEFSYPLYDRTHHFTGHIGIAVDHTNPAYLLDELRRTRLILEQSDRIKSAFFANISHEVRTPLNIIMGFSDLLHMMLVDKLNENEQKLFMHIQDGGKRLLRTFDHILEYSNIQSGIITPNKTFVNVADQVHANCHMYEQVAEEHGACLVEEYPDEQLYLHIDNTSFMHALDNLIDNAVKFSEAGRITVRVSRVAADVVIEIIDTGIGISREYLDHLFDIPSQEDTGYSRPFEGCGLGLALTKCYVEMNEGTIAIESEKGEGTHVTLRFPRAVVPGTSPRAKEHRHLDAKIPRPVKDRAHILVAEDDLQNQQFMKAVLERDHHVHFAASGEDVWQMVTTQPIDLILMDLTLQGEEDGLDVTRRVRAHPATKDIPIIALTAHTWPQDKRRCFEAGCNAFETKPVSIKTLKRLLADLLS